MCAADKTCNLWTQDFLELLAFLPSLAPFAKGGKKKQKTHGIHYDICLTVTYLALFIYQRR